MARKASSKPADSTATGVGSFGIHHSGFVISSAWVQHFIRHLAPQTALRDSATLQREACPQVVREAKDNMAGFVLANGSMSSNQSGDCHARSASLQSKAKLQSLPRQRDIRRALIEADLVDTALRDSAFPQCEAISQVMSAAKNNMVALPGQLFYSTEASASFQKAA